MKFFISTGESSGDLHASLIIKEMKKINKDAKFYGIAGEHCKKLGVEILQDIRDISVMGFTDSLKKYSMLKKKSEEYLEFLEKEGIDSVILVDYGGFNLRFLKLIKDKLANIKVFYYIPPKIWVWGEKRIEKLKLVDHILVIFPWEVEFYKKHNVAVTYFGNPFVEIYQENEKHGNKILLLPGSRKSEIKSILPIFLELVRNKKDEEFIIKLSNKNDLDYIDDKLETYTNLEISCDSNLSNIVADCRLSVATSGTVNLELAMLNIPTIVVYKTNYINYFIAKYLLKVKLISLPNIILNKEIYKELIQNDFNCKNIIKEIEIIDKNREEILLNIKEVRDKISGENIINNYAKFILEETNCYEENNF